MFSPDPSAVIAEFSAKLAALDARVAKIEAASPSAPPATDEAAKFLARWAPVSAAEFEAKYGIAYHNAIPAMPAYDEAEAIFRARAGYATDGRPTRGISRIAEVALPALDIIAHATQETAGSLYETGNGLCDPDVAMYGFYTGLFATKDEFAHALGVGITPRQYAGSTLESLLAPNFGGGAPSGG